MSQTVRTLTITEAEETALVDMIKYFNDLGWINDSNIDEYESLSEKICEPAFWEYSQQSGTQNPLWGFFIGIIKEWGKAIRQDLISDCQTELPHN